MSEDLTAQELKWVEDYCNETITPEEFERFEAAMLKSPSLRAATRQYLALDANLRSSADLPEELEDAWTAETTGKVVRFPRWIPIAAAAAVAFFVGILLDGIFRSDTNSVSEETVADVPEVTAEGYAVVHGLVDAAAQGGLELRVGEMLGAEVLDLTSGSARIDFFSGAQLYVEAPAKLEVVSAWEATLHSGKLRVKVPPAARGFVVESNGRRIVDLGTEFGVDTSSEEVRVEVFSGEVELEDRKLTEGQAVALRGDGETIPIGSSIESFSNLFGVSKGFSDTAKRAFEVWKKSSEALSEDPRVIAYYPFLAEPSGEADRVPSGLYPQDGELDGAAILTEWVDGRWGGLKSAVEFSQPGSRVRVKIPGEFSAYSFSCWARIDSLDRQYNALFLSDGYEDGEPHWQIHQDGRMMFGVMVDETRPEAARDGLTKITGLRAARSYYTPQIWDMSMSGQWIHLVSTFDPANRRVAQYVNGELVSQHKIKEGYVIDQLRIGNAEIGNWGQPFRKDPEFAIRNLNGRIDELVVFKEAISAEEVKRLYDQGRSK
ncbi:LamG-like jellyroll fold domain-containing protein [Pelagicoccus mobilis]|uniref:FecR domain-containing protein n=1 Tax=Pelagicoccus mobilis TaxID=415221 RepID=A0A934VN84_9BACT|nr:LamG-like jellyroll fold domain-containing protein [Pelagicoccus mobilis]MBK1875962.1 FecR domain-containing protein [Pelagicoccus mobilis]